MPAGDRNRESLAGTKASYIVCRPGKGIGIYDEQFRRLMSTGRNSPSKKAAKRDLLHYLSGSCTRDELAGLSKLSPDELAARHHYKILYIERSLSPAGYQGAKRCTQAGTFSPNFDFSHTIFRLGNIGW